MSLLLLEHTSGLPCVMAFESTQRLASRLWAIPSGLGDISRALGDQTAQYCGAFKGVLLENLQSDILISFSSRVMIQNWLVNPTGKPNSWVPVDLLQEHMNFWIKVSISVTPLQLISPADYYRQSTRPKAWEHVLEAGTSHPT